MASGSAGPGRLDLVTLLVDDVDRSKAYYRDVLGLSIVKDSAGYVELGTGGARLALYSRAGLEKLLGVKVGRVDLSLEVGSFDDVDRVYGELVARGAEPARAPETMPWGHRVAFFRDPDGNLVEIVGRSR